MLDTLKRLFSAPQRRASPLFDAAISTERQFGGAPDSWARPEYGNYYATSVLVYSAIRMRADSVSRPPLRVFMRRGEDVEQVAEDHPLQQLLDKVNPWWTRGDLWRATETYLGLWGAAYWVLTKAGPNSRPTEIYPARPDRMRVIASKQSYIQGYEYRGIAGRALSLRPDEVVWLRYFNPLDELSGLSPMASLRLSADMGRDALLYNRNVFRNGMLFGGVAIETSPETTPSDQDIADFYKRLEARFAGPQNAHRPIVLGAGMNAKNLGFSLKEMEYVQSLRWSLEDVARAYNVPKVLLHDLERATYSNYAQAEIMFWRSTIIPQLMFLEESINEMLVPQFGADLFVRFDLSSIEALQEDIDRLHERLRGDVAAGMLTINEARKQLHLEPQPWGDTWWAPAGVLPVEALEPAPAEGKALPWKTRGMWRALDDRAIDRLDSLHQRRLDRNERRIAAVVKRLFQAQRKDTLAEAARLFAGLVSKAGPPVFRPSEWEDRFARAILPPLQAALIDAAREQGTEFNLGVFDVANPLVNHALGERAEFLARHLNEETARLLGSELREALALGESIPDIEQRIRKVFDFSVGFRTERIARTESQWATNKGAVEAYRQSGLVEEKMWLATLDDRVRPDHRDAHEQVVPLDSPFIVGGEPLMHPGDGSPAQAINCRCTVVPVMSRNRAMAGPQADGNGHKPEQLETLARALEESEARTAERLAQAESRIKASHVGKATKVVKRVKRDENGFPVEVEETHE